MTNSKFWALCGIVLLTALLLRFGAVLAARPWSEQYLRLYLIHDPQVYHDLAVIFQKDGITEEFRNTVAIYAPGYPILLGIVYKLFGVNLMPPVILNVLLSVITCIVLMVTTRKVFGERTAIVAGLLFALHPHSIRFSTILYSETLFMLIASIFVLGLLYIQPLNKKWVWGVVNVALVASLGAFSRISMLYFSVLAVLCWIISNKSGWRLALQQFSLFAIIYLIFLSPWMIHNKLHHGTFRLSVSGEYNLLALVVGSAKADDLDTFHVLKNELLKSAYERARQDGVDDIFEISRYFLDLAVEEISKEPSRFLLAQIKGLYNFWFRPVQARSSRVAELTENDPKIVYYIYYSHVFHLFLFLAWIALFFDKGRIPTPWKVLSVVAVVYFAFTVGNAAYSRFFLHALPYIIPVAAVNMVSFYDWARRAVLNRPDSAISR
jgi:4-amino-4-deoxy-L-arabinose transferase-like glycosyltransferase